MSEKKDLKNIKKHLFFILLLLVITLLYLHELWFDHGANEMFPSDLSNANFPGLTILKDSIYKYHDLFPLWDPFYLSGTPFMSKGNYGIESILTPLSLVIPIIPAIKLNWILVFFLSGVSMYFFMIYLKLEPKYAFISGIVYAFNGFTAKRLGGGGELSMMTGYILIPLIIMFTMKSLKEKKWLLNSVITGIIFSVQMMNDPGMKTVLFTGLIVGILLMINLIGRKFYSRLIKISIIVAIILLILFGLNAHRIIPTKEYMDYSSRSSTSWEQSIKRKIPINKLFVNLVEPIYKGMPKILRVDIPSYHIGIFAFFLAILAVFYKWKNKNVIFFLLIIIMALLIVTASPLFYFLWKYIPPFNMFRYVERALSIYEFAGAALAGIGISVLFNKILKKKNLTRKMINLIYWPITILILLNLTVFSINPIQWDDNYWFDLEKAVKNNEVMNYISEQPGIFRMHTHEVNGIDWPGALYTTPLFLEDIYGPESTWEVEYFNEYLAISYNSRAKFYSILNMKYITSKEPLNISGYKFIKKFNKCEECSQADLMIRHYGPYLYENEKFLPRAYVVENAVLVVGEKNAAKQTIYGLMLNSNFNPATTAIIYDKEKIDDYSLNELKHYKSIVLTQGSIRNSVGILKQYVDLGGIVVPNILENKNTIAEADIIKILNNAKEMIVINDDQIISKDYDNKEIKLNKANSLKGKFLVLSEKYWMFNGWSAKTENGNPLRILRTNSMVSSVYLDDNYDKIILSYYPSSFKKGKWITIFTFFVIILFLILIRGR